MTQELDVLVTPLEEQAPVVENEGHTEEYVKGFKAGYEQCLEAMRAQGFNVGGIDKDGHLR